MDLPTEENLDKEMAGNLPSSLKNLTFSGAGLKKLGVNVFKVRLEAAEFDCVVLKI